MATTITGKKLTIDGYTFDLNNEQDYEVVTNKPKIEGTELNGDKSFSELGKGCVCIAAPAFDFYRGDIVPPGQSELREKKIN